MRDYEILPQTAGITLFLDGLRFWMKLNWIPKEFIIMAIFSLSRAIFGYLSFIHHEPVSFVSVRYFSWRNLELLLSPFLVFLWWTKEPIIFTWKIMSRFIIKVFMHNIVTVVKLVCVPQSRYLEKPLPKVLYFMYMSAIVSIRKKYIFL